MYQYEILLKDGSTIEAECKWLDITTIHNLLIDHQPFITVGCLVLAKDSIAMIKKIEKEN